MEKRKYDLVYDYLDNLYSEELLELWNEYCESIYNDDDKIWELTDDFLDETFSSPSDLAQNVDWDDFRYTDDYCTFDGYGKLVSFDYLSDHIDIAFMVEWYAEEYEDTCVEEIWVDLLEDLEAEAFKKAQEMWNNTGCNADDLWDICQEVADDYEVDADELYNKVWDAETYNEEYDD